MKHYLEIGTSDFDTLNDQRAGDPNWRGVSVEAVPEYFGRLHKHDKNNYVNGICLPAAGEPVEFHYVPADIIEASGFPVWLRGCGSTKKHHVARDRFQEHVVTVELPVVTPEQLLVLPALWDNVTQKPRVDWLRVDTEGCDIGIVNAVLDLTQPGTVEFEDVHADQDALRKLTNRLHTLGYSFRKRYGDSAIYGRPTLLLLADAKWATGSIARDLVEVLPDWHIYISDYRDREAHHMGMVAAHDATVVFTGDVARHLPDVSAAGGTVICGEHDLDSVAGHKVSGRGRIYTCVSPKLALDVTRIDGPREAFCTPATARSGRFTRKSVHGRPKILGAVARSDVDPGDPVWGAWVYKIKRYHWLHPMAEQAGWSLELTEGCYTYWTMQDFYDKLAMFVCSSALEGGPLTLFEAIACGVPVISTKVGMALEFASIPKFHTLEEAVELLRSYDSADKLDTLARTQYDEFSSGWTMEQLAPLWDKFFRRCAAYRDLQP